MSCSSRTSTARLRGYGTSSGWAASARHCTRSAIFGTSPGYAQVVAQQPVNEMSVQAAIMSPEAYAYGTTITPAYLK